MPITASAKKALRRSQRRRVFNLRRKRALGGAVKKLKKLIAERKFKETPAALSAAFQAVDKAAKKGVIKKNAAARKKSRLALFLRRNEEAAREDGSPPRQTPAPR